MLIIVPKNEVAIVERLGKFQNILASGVHLAIPLLDRIRIRLPLTDQSQEIAEE